jgi:Protein of unknown function (DUF2808)
MKQVYTSVAIAAATLMIGLSEGATSLDLRSVSFDQAPRLSQVRMVDRRVYFTVTIPQNAGEGLAKLSFSDRTPTALAFNLEQTQVFLGTPEAVGQTVELEDAWVDETGVVWVEFAPSIAPGTMFTVSLAVGQNVPSDAREYGVAAYPDSENSVPAFVGDGTLIFK